MRELMATANNIGVGEDFVRHRFRQTLPPTITPVIADARNLTLGELVILSDKLILFMKMDMVQNITYSEHYRRQTRPTANTKNETHTEYHTFHENQRLQVCRGHSILEKSQTGKPWRQWPNKSGCKIQPSYRSTSPVRESMSNEEFRQENY